MKQIIESKLCPVLSSKVLAQSIEKVPVIIQLKEEGRISIEGLSSLTNEVFTSLPLINGVGTMMNTDMIYKLIQNDDVEFISFDSRVYTLLDVARRSVDAPFPHRSGFDGEGITVAVVDTGVSPHVDLIKPKNRIVGFIDLINKRDLPYDDNGHGTHIAGIIGANGYASRGKLMGVAPGVNILAIKALDGNGSGTTSHILEAIEYIINTKDDYNTRVINLSIGTPSTIPSIFDPLSRAVKRAVKAGLLVVVAAGNSGPNSGTILSPGISEYALTVGAVDDKRTKDTSDDTIAPFSSRGPTRDGRVKPDLLAPGVNINSLSNIKMDGYNTLSGTSMATPLVSGSAALLLNKDSSLSPLEIKELLMDSSVDLKTGSQDGVKMLNLKKLFSEDKRKEDERKEDEDNLEAAVIKKNPMIEHIFMVLIVLFILDSRL